MQTWVIGSPTEVGFSGRDTADALYFITFQLGDCLLNFSQGRRILADEWF